MQSSTHSQTVCLGFAQRVETCDLFRLRSQYLPLGKIGGKPSWLNPTHLPSSEELACKVCNKPMCFMLQVYATRNDDPPHSFHRSLFLFVCKNADCSKPNDSSNMAVFRCGLRRDNPFYSSEGPLDPDLDGDVPDPRKPADAPNLCEICGCFASKKCGRCGQAWYCCRDHQALHWTTGHKATCGQPLTDTTIAPTSNPQNRFLFEELGIEMDQEYVPADYFDDVSDGESEDEEDDCQRRLAEFRQLVETQTKKGEDLFDDGAEEEEVENRDECFESFHRLLELNPEQILRYARGGVPLVATSKAPPLSEPERCLLCNAEREYELQLTPHLLSVLGVDAVGNSIDWASVYVYTCKNSCQVPNDGYAREYIVKQDFVS